MSTLLENNNNIIKKRVDSYRMVKQDGNGTLRYKLIYKNIST